jgi:hypothetical protein
MNKPPIINIKMVPAGVELVLAALNKMPREQSDGIYQEIESQYQFQLIQIKSLQLSQQLEGKTE